SMSLRIVLCVVLGAAAAGCGGGGGDQGEPLISGSLTGDYNGASFTAVNGFATIYMGSGLIGAGEADLHCGSENDANPPGGYNAAIAIPTLTAGSYPAAFVTLYGYTSGNFEGVGSNQATVTIASATADSIAGTVEYDYTDDMSRHFALNGTF